VSRAPSVPRAVDADDGLAPGTGCASKPGNSKGRSAPVVGTRRVARETGATWQIRRPSSDRPISRVDVFGPSTP